MTSEAGREQRHLQWQLKSGQSRSHASLQRGEAHRDDELDGLNSFIRTRSTLIKFMLRHRVERVTDAFGLVCTSDDVVLELRRIEN